MKKFLTLILLAPFLTLHAQKFYFPKHYYADSIELQKNMPALANQIVKLFTSKDPLEYFDNLFRYQIVAGEYAKAISNIDSLQHLIAGGDPASAKAVGFQFVTYALAKTQAANPQQPFSTVYTTVFENQYNSLSEEAMTTAAGYFDANVKSLHSSLYKMLAALANTDSIGFDEARALCRTYNSYMVYSQIIPLAHPALKAIENKKYIVEDSVLITMRDGAKVTAVIVRRRDAPPKLPCVLVFNIYNSPRDKSEAIQIALKGYVGIVANTRGKNLSPEEIEPFEHDAKDAYDIIDWISKQPWSNGKVGMYGGSYLGFSQWAAAKTLHPALKTIIPQVAVGIGIDYPMQNSVFMSYMLRWIHYVTNSKETDDADFGDSRHWAAVFRKWYSTGKAFRLLDSIEGRPSKIFKRWLQHPSHDAYWQNMVAYKNDFANINIPILTTTGYFDGDQLGAMYYFNQHYKYNKNANHFLLIGPYDHASAQSTPQASLGGYDIDSVANISITNLAFKWFDYILKDSARPGILQDKVNYQVMGTNQWKHAPSLAKMNNDTLTFYLSDVRLGQHYKLDENATTIGFIKQEVNLSDRADSVSRPDDGDKPIVDSVLDTNNGLSFITKPFAKPFDINGAFLANLNAAINKKDMDINFAVYEQTPNGKFFNLSTTILRASYAVNRSQRKLLQPGAITNIPVNNTFFTSRHISAGSRLLLVLSINKSPNWQINYGTGKDVSDETIADGVKPLEIKWYNNSSIKIPVFRQ